MLISEACCRNRQKPQFPQGTAPTPPAEPAGPSTGNAANFSGLQPDRRFSFPGCGKTSIKKREPSMTAPLKPVTERQDGWEFNV